MRVQACMYLYRSERFFTDAKAKNELSISAFFGIRRRFSDKWKFGHINASLLSKFRVKCSKKLFFLDPLLRLFARFSVNFWKVFLTPDDHVNRICHFRPHSSDNPVKLVTAAGTRVWVRESGGKCAYREREVGGVDVFLLLNTHGRHRLCKCMNLIFKRTALLFAQ